MSQRLLLFLYKMFSPFDDYRVITIIINKDRKFSNQSRGGVKRISFDGDIVYTVILHILTHCFFAKRKRIHTYIYGIK